jgi:uncharacterized LabA/DUF88 family protein
VAARGEWYLFVDGENLTARAENFMHGQGSELIAGRFWQPGTYVWLPRTIVDDVLVFTVGWGMHQRPKRAMYYTTAGGDQESRDTIHDRLQQLGFAPMVFPYIKKTGRSKGVDIALTRDMLSHAYKDNYDVAVLITGDADFLPLVDEVQRQGKAVVLGFFGVANGLDVKLRRAVDYYVNLDQTFLTYWAHYVGEVRAGNVPDEGEVRIPKPSPKLPAVPETS